MNWQQQVLPKLFQAKRFRGEYGNVWACYKACLAWEYAAPDVFEAAMVRRREALLRYAYQHVPYYRELLGDAGVVRDDRVDLARFTELPLLTKDILRGEKNRLVSGDADSRGVYGNTSGGSTGEPVPFVQDREYQAWNWATALFYNHMVGKEPGQPEAKLWGSERDVLQGSIGLAAKVQNLVYNRLLLNSFHMTPEALDRYVGQLNQFKPRSLWAYVDSAHELARFVRESARPIHPIPATVVTAGTLNEPVREEIEAALGTRVYNQYGSREVGPIACECPAREGLHVFEWANHVEVVDKEGKPCPPGDTGEVCVTLLTNFSMPLIRYRIGDMAVWKESPCSCGRPMRLLAAVKGRTTEHFIRRDGTLVHGEYFAHMFYGRDWVIRFQVVQTDYERIVNYVVARERPSEETLAEVTAAFQAAMGQACAVHFEFVETIPPTASGKYLYTRSEVPR